MCDHNRRGAFGVIILRLINSVADRVAAHPRRFEGSQQFRNDLSELRALGQLAGYPA
jgi:putative AlgH/UPF0301 family transcriptional regulator